MNFKHARPCSMAAAASAVLLVSSAAFAARSPSSGPSGRSRDAVFNRLDRYSDGIGSRGEAASEPLLAKGFADADENRDERLSPEEFVRARSTYRRARLAAYGRDACVTARVKAALLENQGEKP